MVRLQTCEKMGWTFAEYDATPAADLYGAFEVWRLMEEERAKEQATKKHGKR